MRRTLLGFFLLLAACGGGVRNDGSTAAVNPDADMRAQYQRFLLSADARAVLAPFARSNTQDAIDTCASAWVDESFLSAERPIRRPDVVSFRAFLRACLRAPAGDRPSDGDLRAAAGNADARMSRSVR